MSEDTSVKERITAEIDKVKQQERARAEKVQGIMREAFSQAVVEVKEGTGEIRTIAQTAFSETVEGLKEKGKNLQDFKTSIESGVEEEKLKGQFFRLGQRLAALDSQLSAWYNARFAGLRQRFTTKATGWYSSLSEEQKADLRNKYSGAKTTFLAKQQEVRQRLRDLLQSTASKL